MILPPHNTLLSQPISWFRQTIKSPLSKGGD
jgi:hypothetical protein